MYVYQFQFPIDHFGAMQKFSKYFQDAVHHHSHADETDEHDTPDELRKLLLRSLRALARLSTAWDATIQDDELYIASIPSDDDHAPYYSFLAFKQRHDGISYVISSTRLISLDANRMDESHKHPIPIDIQHQITWMIDHFAPIPQVTPSQLQSEDHE